MAREDLIDRLLELAKTQDALIQETILIIQKHLKDMENELQEAKETNESD